MSYSPPSDGMSAQESSPESILMQKGLSHFIHLFLEKYFADHEGLTPACGLYDRILTEVERPLLTTTLTFVGGNQKKAAMLLGINRNTLRKKLLELGLLQKSVR